MKRWLMLLSVVLLAVMLAACDDTGQEGEGDIEPNEAGEIASLGEPFQIMVGEEVTLTDSDVTISLLEVSDSRCPSDVECVQAGQVTGLFQVESGGREEQFDLTLNTDQPAVTEAAGHQVMLLEVNPYPSSDNMPRQGDYTALVQIDQ